MSDVVVQFWPVISLYSGSKAPELLVSAGCEVPDDAAVIVCVYKNCLDHRSRSNTGNCGFRDRNRSPTVAIFINIIYSPVLKTLARWA